MSTVLQTGSVSASQATHEISNHANSCQHLMLSFVTESKHRYCESKKDFLGVLGIAVQETEVQIAPNQCSEEGRKGGSLYGLSNAEKEPD